MPHVEAEVTGFYTVAEAARIIGYHPESVRRLLRKGRLFGHKPEGRWFITHRALVAWAGIELDPRSPDECPRSDPAESVAGMSHEEAVSG